MLLEEILSEYNLSTAMIEPFGTVLINRTWIVKKNGKDFILQRINENVYNNPENISNNIDLIASYLKQTYACQVN